MRVVLGVDGLRLQLTPSAQVVVTRRWCRSSCHRCYLVHLHIHLPGPLHGSGHHPFNSHLGLSCVHPRAAASGLHWCCRYAWLTVRCCALRLSHHLAFMGCWSALHWAGAHWLQHCGSWLQVDHLTPRVACWAHGVHLHP